jgi:hypothetical protein
LFYKELLDLNAIVSQEVSAGRGGARVNLLGVDVKNMQGYK